MKITINGTALTDKEANTIENALNCYWNDANYNLTERGKQLGDLEKTQYEKQLNNAKELLIKLQR